MQISQFVIDLGLVYFGSKLSFSVPYSALNAAFSMATHGFQILTLTSSHWELCRLGICSYHRVFPAYQLSVPLHQLLLPNVQEAQHIEKARNE